MRRTVTVVAILSLALVGCGGSSSDSGDDAGSSGGAAAAQDCGIDLEGGDDSVGEPDIVLDEIDDGGDGARLVSMSGERSDAQVVITMSTEEVANDAAGNLTFETVVPLTWTPIG